MIYGDEDNVHHDYQVSHKESPSKPEGDILQVQILNEARQSISEIGEGIHSAKYDQAKYVCVGNICMAVNEAKDTYTQLAEKQKQEYYKEDEAEDNWLQEYAAKSYKQYEQFEDYYNEDNYEDRGYNDEEEFAEAIAQSAAPEQCEHFLTIPEYACKMLKDTLDDCVDVMPIVRRIKQKETAPQESSTNVEEITYEKYASGPSKSDEYFAYVAEEKKGFTNWPSIDVFNVELGAYKIDEYLSSFDTDENWLYVIYYQGKQETHCSDLYKYQAIYSLPTWRYPIAQATASIYFEIEVCRAKPKHCSVDVTFKYETFRHVFKPGHLDFNEKWLHHILDAKINLFKTLTF